MFSLFFETETLNMEEINTVKILNKIDARNYDEAKKTAKERIYYAEVIKNKEPFQNAKNDAYVLTCFYKLLHSVSMLWENIEEREYYASWCKLQDSIDLLREIKRHYREKNATLSFFESQLLSIEIIYPYKLFSSIGFIVDKYECSICGHDIDSDECLHLIGELYFGEKASGIIRKVTHFDHIAIVEKPLDKRLVIGINDKHQSFKIFNDLIEYFNIKNIGPLSFSGTNKIEFNKENENWKNTPRNKICYCGSGIKFKKCCIDKKTVRHLHIDFTGKSIFR